MPEPQRIHRKSNLVLFRFSARGKSGTLPAKGLAADSTGTLERFAERIGRQLFKLAVEQNVNNHILASDTDIDARSYQKMRGLSMDEVKRTNGRIDFEDALLGERGV